MCSRCAKIPCEVVEGAAKGFENEDFDEFPIGSHFWCVVYIDGSWRFIDQSFGCSHVNLGAAHWQVVDSDLDFFNKQEDIKEAAIEHVHYIGEEHFLTDPEFFVFKHFTEEEGMQLLARPVTHKEFNAMAVVNKVYFDWEFEEMSEPKCKITCDDGVVEIWFKTKPGLDVHMNFILMKRTDIERDKKLKELVRLENKDGKKFIRIYFKHIGLYKLQIIVPDRDSHRKCNHKSEKEAQRCKKLTWHVMVQYTIRCNCPYFPAIKTPLLASSLQEIGCGATWEQMGIKCDLQGGIINTVNGYAKMELRCTKEPVFFNFHLKKENDSEEEHEKCILLEVNHELTTVHIKTSSHGTFLLKAYTGTAEEPSLIHTCNFLVESDMPCVTGLFPLELQKVIGTVNNSLLLKPRNTGAYVCVSEEEDEHLLEMSITENTHIDFLVKLFYYTGHHEVHLTEHVWCEQTSDLLWIFCRFKWAGDYIVRIFNKMDPKSTSYSAIWKYLLRVETPSNCAQPYTEKLVNWDPCMTLVSPKVQNLKHSTDYQFVVHVPGIYSYTFLNDHILLLFDAVI